MADRSWWFNGAGAVAPVSNPGSAVPNYGLTMDVTTAPWDEKPNYEELAKTLQAVQEQNAKPTLWDRATGLVDSVVGGVQAAAGAVAYGASSLDEFLGTDSERSREVQALGDEAREQGITGADRFEYITERLLGAEMEESTENPAVRETLEGLDTVQRAAGVPFLFASLSQDDTGFNRVGQRWSEAKELAFSEGGFNFGEAVMSLGWDREILDDEERMEQIREHHTLFNVGALGFNVIAAWKADPTVLLGKSLGQVRNWRAGVLSKDNPRASAIERDILSQRDKAGAEASARNYTGMRDRVYARRGLSLYDKSLELRDAAKTMGFEEFSNLGPFRPGYSANGPVMARLMKDAADSDDDWNLLFRTVIGDDTAIDELAFKQGEYASKIVAIEGSLPSLEKQLGFIEKRFNERLAEQGGKPGRDTQLIVTGYGDRWLNDEVTNLRAAVDEQQSMLSSYRDYQSFLERTMKIDDETGLPSRTDVNSVFNQLNQVNPGRGGRFGGIKGSMYAYGAKVDTFAHDDYSPVSRVFRAPSKPFLKRVGVVSLSDVDEGGQAVHNYLDQIAYVTGKQDQAVRDSILHRWAGTTNEIQRKEIVDELERQGIAMVGQRHGISQKTMDLLAARLQEERGRAWGRMSDRTLYTTAKRADGTPINRFQLTDDEGNILDAIDMPVSPTELPNWRPLTNLTDLERDIAQHRDLLREIDKDLDISAAAAKSAKVRRQADALYNLVGESFNTYWKPLALLSLRWPARVVADESMRIMLFTDIASHMGAWMEGARNTVYNKGWVRPREWWVGRDRQVRAVNTGSIAEDSLRVMTEPFDSYDYRAISNPTGAVPARVLDMDRIDQKRYAKLNEATATRGAETRTLGYYKGTAEKTKWQQRWDDRLLDAEKTNRGFFFDPATDKAVKKGFAVSPYPGRLQTFGQKPGAKAMNAWVEKNSDLLAVKGNRVAVWLDRDTGRWHMDVVKVAKTKADAARLADEVEATEFYDIEDGFTRYLDEENFFGHFSNPSAFDQGGFDAVKVADVTSPLPDMAPAPVKGIGFGTRKFKSADGREVEVERVFGKSPAEKNIYHSLVSSKDAIQTLLGGYTRGLGMNRSRRVSAGYTAFDPGDVKAPDFLVKKGRWEQAYTEYVNKHMRMDPIWLRMLNGESDEAIEKWLHTAAGRRLRERMGPRGVNPHKWVAEMRAVFDHTFTTPKVREAARVRDITPDELDDVIPHAYRNDIHGEQILSVAGKGQAREAWNNFVAKWYDRLGSMPTDALVRHPFASNMYELRMRTYLGSLEADKITPQVLAAAEASSRTFALKQVRRLLYNMADEHEGIRMLRFLSPFAQAQYEVLERYFYLMARKPEAAARLGLLFNGSQSTSVPGVFEVQDSEGNPAEGWDRDNKVVLQVNDFWRGMANHIPGLKGALDKAGDIAIPTASLNMVFQGEGLAGPFVPSAGPLVTIPASEFYFRDRAEFATADGLAGSIYRNLFPFGTPDGSNAMERTGKALLPGWLRRAVTERFSDFDDSAFANRVNQIHSANMLEWERSGKAGPKPKMTDALESTKAEYRLRAFSQLVLPFPTTPRSPYQFYMDEARKFRDKYGVEAGDKFYEKYGSDYFAFFTESSKSLNGLAPTAEGKVGYDRNKKLIDQAPDLAGVIAGPFHGLGEFNDAVYQWQIETRKSPTSKDTMREIKDPDARWADMQVDRGWIEYSKLSAAVDVELRNRGLTSLENNGAEDLKAWRDREVEGIIARNPAWQDAYRSRQDTLGSWLNQAYSVAFDKSLDGRTDIEGLRAYLISRAKMQDTLQELQAQGVVESDNLSATSNPVIAELAAGWDSYLHELTSKNLLFAEIYRRYLENDDLSVFIDPMG